MHIKLFFFPLGLMMTVFVNELVSKNLAEKLCSYPQCQSPGSTCNCFVLQGIYLWNVLSLSEI